MKFHPFKSRFNEMFGSVIKSKKMKLLGTYRNGLNFKKLESGVMIKCIGVGDFHSHLYTDEISEIESISIEKISEGHYLENGDIIFVRSNGNKALIGRSMLARNLPKNTSFSGFCISFRCDSDEILPGYLIHYLHQDSVHQKLFSKGRGCNISNLTQEMLGDLDIPLAPLEVQNEFISFVEEIDKSKFILHGQKCI